jgi:hypothetical protein
VSDFIDQIDVRFGFPLLRLLLLLLLLYLYSVALDVMTLSTVTSPPKRGLLVCSLVLAAEESPVGGLISK